MVKVRDAPIPESDIGTDTMVEFSTRICKIGADTTTQNSVWFNKLNIAFN